MARLLVVDDDKALRSVVRKFLESEGHTVVEAEDGRAAAALYRQATTDLIITDIFMPGKEGLESIYDLRREFPEVKIIAMSGGGSVGHFDPLPVAKKLGVLKTLSKPFSLADLLSAVHEALGVGR